MEYSILQIEILKLIYDAPNHCISTSSIELYLLDYPTIKEELQILIEAELVEYELKENSYYLSYFGFEILENKDPIVVNDSLGIVEYESVVKSFGSTKQFHKHLLLATAIIVIFGMTLLYFFPEMAEDYQRKSTIQLDENHIEELKRQIESFVDSVKQAEELNNKE